MKHFKEIFCKHMDYIFEVIFSAYQTEPCFSDYHKFCSHILDPQTTITINSNYDR